MALTPGDWFLTAVNVSGGPATYSIKATEFSVYATNVIITNWSIVSNSYFCFSWTSVPDVHYFVQGLTNLNGTNWTTISPTITASSFLTTYCVPLPSIYHFFRVGEGFSALSANASVSFSSIVRLANGVQLEWIAPTNYQFKVQWTPAIPSVTWNVFSNVMTSTNGVFTFLDDGSQTGGFSATRFYRLQQLVP